MIIEKFPLMKKSWKVTLILREILNTKNKVVIRYRTEKISFEQKRHYS